MEAGLGDHEFHIIPTHFLGGSHHGNDRPNRQGHCDQLTAGILQARQGAGEIALVRTVRGAFRQGQSLFAGGSIGDGLVHFLAEIRGDVHHTDFLDAVLIGHPVNAFQYPFVVAGTENETMGKVALFFHLPGQGQRKNAGHVIAVHQRESCQVMGGAQAHHHGEDFIAADQLVGGLGGLGHLVGMILDDVTNLAAMNTAFGIHFGKHVVGHLHRR